MKIRTRAWQPVRIAAMVAIVAAPMGLSCGGTSKPPATDPIDRTTYVPETTIPTEIDSTWNVPSEPWVIDPEIQPEDIETAAAIVANYGKGAHESQVDILLQQGEKRWGLTVVPFDRDQSRILLID